MAKRRLNNLNANSFAIAVLCVVLTGIGWSVYRLQTIFLSENQRSRVLLEERQDYIERAAKQLFVDALKQKMTIAINTLPTFVSKPFVLSEGLYWRKGQQQMLPLDWHFSQMPADNAISHYHQLRKHITQVSAENWPEDEQLLWRLVQATQQNQETIVEQSARDIMAYDVNHRFASRHELVYRLLFVETLAAYPQASSLLLADLIRDDITDDQGPVLNALQKELLRRRNDFSRQEFDFLKQHIATVAKQAQVRHDDFLQAADPNNSSIIEPPSITAPTLWQHLERQWYLDHRDGNVYGIAVEVDALKSQVVENLSEQNWLAPEDSLTLVADEFTPVTELGFRWSSPTFQQNLQQLQNFYHLKQFILYASILSMALAAVLLWWFYRRQMRWVGIKSEFVATVAHEMRTPLSSIRLMAERLAGTLEGEQKAKDYPQRLLADIDTLSFLAENILSFERLQSGQWVAHKSPIVLTEVVQTLEQELPLFVKKPFGLCVSSDMEYHIQADPALIKLLFLNLAKNSCAYNDNAQALITISAREEGNLLCIDFRDNGVGIVADEQEDCFAPFYRGKNQRHTRGSGLGLALCQKIMGLHQGAIVIVASDNQGTLFRLTFPEFNSL